MRLKILSSVQHDGTPFKPGALVAIPEAQAIALIRAKAAEPAGRASAALWAVHAKADLVTQQKEDAAQAVRGLPHGPEYINVWGRDQSKGGAHV